MSQDWITSEAGQKVLSLEHDPHPAWLWTAGGGSVWQNRAAVWFRAKQKKHGPRPAGPAMPIKGQVKRLLRLSFGGLSSLARVQMTVDEKPVSQTCRCAPLRLADGSAALLCVSADSIDEELVGPVSDTPAQVNRLLSHLGPHVFVDSDGRVLSGSRDGLAAAENEALDNIGDLKRTDVGQGVVLVEFPQAEMQEAVAPSPAQADAQPLPIDTDEPAEPHPHIESTESGRLAGLMERFSEGSSLYEPLGPQDEELPAALVPKQATAEDSSTPAQVQALGPGDDFVDPADLHDLVQLETDSELTDVADHEEAEPEDTMSEPAGRQWRVTGRGFVADQAADEPAALEPVMDGGVSDASENADQIDSTGADTPEELDRSARYNFDELARILTERVTREQESYADGRTAATGDKLVQRAKLAGRTLNLSDEHLVLNRLPLGILVFREQDIIFANRAMADLLSCKSISELRDRGLESIFPRMDAADAILGPVATLLDSQGSQVPVTARLQSISWQGGPALMLSARREDAAPSGEAAIRSFAQTLAMSQGEGFIEVSRAGVIDGLSSRAAELFKRTPDVMIGRPLALFVAPRDIPVFKSHLEKPAKRAGSERPSLRLNMHNGLQLTLFTEGSAGIVSGYFGLLTPAMATDQPPRGDRDNETPDPSMLSRMSRGLRRPLNTIIGFSQLIETQAFGALGNVRYLEYARDIQSAGRDIEGLVDEIDQYARLQAGQYVPQSSEFELDKLLEECETVVRQQAGRRQVFVRSAISEKLPLISADRTSMRQAVLNLLASAIDQTPQGGKVILSAHTEDDGSVGVHVRDSSSAHGEMAERFAVFREAGAKGEEAMVPLKSSIGLALTRSLLAVNACSLSIYPSSGTGTLMSLIIPIDLVSKSEQQAD